jgi:hypothetical protein
MRGTSRPARLGIALLGTAFILAACTPDPGTARPWSLATEPEPGVLVVSFWGRPPRGGPTDYCGADYTGTAAETAARIVVTVYEHSNPPPPNVRIACPALAAGREVRLTLTGPVGGRTVVDGATGQVHPLSPPGTPIP